jgi:hypothetical protein
MERQRTHSPSFKSIAGSVLVGLGILIMLGNVDWAIAQLRNCFYAAAGDAVGIWPCVLLAGCRAMQAYVFHQHGLIGWLLQMLLSLGPLLPGAGGAI